MDVVYRYRHSGSGDELRYSLRSLKNVPYDNLWIVGDSPNWLRAANVIRIPQNKGSKWENSRANVVAACLNSDISDDFIMMDDDFFIVDRVPSIPVYHRGLVRELVKKEKERYNGSQYIIGMVETAELLRWVGIKEEPLSYNLHMPMVINKQKMLECLAAVGRAKPKHIPQCFHLRSWYGNFWHIGGREAKDVKVSRLSDALPEGPFLSTSNSSFNSHPGVRALIHNRLAKPSPYEGVGKREPTYYRGSRRRDWSRTNNR